MTDKASYYKIVGKEFASHETVDHSKDEYVRGDVYTNTVEGYYSIFKRGMKAYISTANRITCIAIRANLIADIQTVSP
jgi:hypothetical protein